ncbi:ubiquinol-cytochrome c reductase cytochrome b subunit [Acidothermaceae bacterium B102]|nr:ubiquinol-cytochrome c reductase cytochrome b subunit [Acidothermaceae bacterium B102]
MSSSTYTKKAKANPAAEAGKAGYAFVDDRLATSSFVKKSLNKVFPDHWSFMLGEIALYSFIILLLSGTFLTLFFNPSDREVIYNGSYGPLNGLKMSEAYASTLNLSFDVRGGLLMRQIHHWAALLFLVSIVVHLMRVFFTGAFRKPREVNWLIGVGLLTLGLLEGFAGYSLPDDLFSGTGLRIGYSILESIPVVGTWIAFFLWGGEFPGHGFLNRLYTVHILLLPGLILALITVHMMILWHQKHTQFPGKGKTETNVVGSKLFPTYAAKGGGFFFLVFAVIAALAALVQVNPVWYWGPYDPAQVSAGTQPDFYLGMLDGALRVTPGWEIHLWHQFTIPINLLFPALILPGLMFTALALWPWIEQRFVTKDYGYHHLLDRPRDNPIRTGAGMMALVFYAFLLFAGGNDIIAKTFHISLYYTTYAFRAGLLFGPPIAYWATKKVCYGLLAKEAEELEHGSESGTIKRLPNGEYIEVHRELNESRRLLLDPHPTATPEQPEVTRQTRRAAISTGRRSRLSDFFYTRSEPEPVATQDDADTVREPLHRD